MSNVMPVSTVGQALNMLEIAMPGDVIVYFAWSTAKNPDDFRAMRVEKGPLFALFRELQGVCGRNHFRRNSDAHSEHIFVVTGPISFKILGQARMAAAAMQNARWVAQS